MFAANFFNLHTNSFDAAVRRQPQKRAKLLGKHNRSPATVELATSTQTH